MKDKRIARQHEDNFEGRNSDFVVSPQLCVVVLVFQQHLAVRCRIRKGVQLD